MTALDSWFSDNLLDPVDRSRLSVDGNWLVSEGGRRYPVVDGVPVMLIPDERQTIGIAHASITQSQAWAKGEHGGDDGLFLESLGITAEERARLKQLSGNSRGGIDPAVSMLLGATSGYAYRHLMGDTALPDYPIPSIVVPPGRGERLLDIGCSWGRWSIAAARKGYDVVGIDPSLGAVMAARRVTRQLGVNVRLICGDARCLPLASGIFDRVYSYSVIQHFSRDDARRALQEVNRTLKPGGTATIQMANRYGIRSLQHQIQRLPRAERTFDVRYYSPGALRDLFARTIGPAKVSVDCFFGLGWQASDYRFFRPRHRPILRASEALKRIAARIAPLSNLADSLFLEAAKPG